MLLLFTDGLQGKAHGVYNQYMSTPRPQQTAVNGKMKNALTSNVMLVTMRHIRHVRRKHLCIHAAALLHHILLHLGIHA